MATTVYFRGSRETRFFFEVEVLDYSQMEAIEAWVRECGEEMEEGDKVWLPCGRVIARAATETDSQEDQIDWHHE